MRRGGAEEAEEEGPAAGSAKRKCWKEREGARVHSTWTETHTKQSKSSSSSRNYERLEHFAAGPAVRWHDVRSNSRF